MLPTVLAGAGILIVAGLMIFWPDDATQTAAKGSSDQASASADAARAGGGRTGVPTREADAAQNAAVKPKYKVNERIRPATELGMSPNPPSTEPPKFDDDAEELEYWKKQLAEAQRVLAMREKAIDRLPKIKEQIMAGNDPEGGLKAFERREKLIHENLGKQRNEVAELEEKVAALEKGG